MEFFGISSLPTALEVTLKIFCIVHVIRNDRSYLWILLILFLPFFGSAIYFFMEVLPGLRAGGRRSGATFQIPQTSARKIAKMREQLEFSNTTKKSHPARGGAGVGRAVSRSPRNAQRVPARRLQGRPVAHLRTRAGLFCRRPV